MPHLTDRRRLFGLAAGAAAGVGIWQVFLRTGMLNPYVILEPTLIARGFIPYVDIEDPRTPLLPTMLAGLQKLLGHDAVLAAHILHAAVSVAAVAALVLWTGRRRGFAAAASAALFYLAWRIPFGYWAIAYYEIVLGTVFFAVFLVLEGHDRRPAVRKIILAGALSGIAFLIKQHAAVLFVAAVIVLVRVRRRSAAAGHPSLPSSLAAFAAGWLAPVGLYLAGYAASGGDLREMLAWTIVYGLKPDYWTMAAALPTQAQLSDLLPAVAALAVFAVSGFFRRGGSENDDARRLPALFFLCALVFLLPRYSTRHLAAAVPFLAVLAGIGLADFLDASRGKIGRTAGRAVAAALILWWASAGIGTAFRTATGPGPPSFSEYTPLRSLASSISARLRPGDGVVIFPVDESNANLYYLLGQAPPYHFDVYPWFTNPWTTRRWLEAVESDRPEKAIVFVGPAGNVAAERAPQVFAYLEANYRLLERFAWTGGTVEIRERKKAP